MQKNMKMKRSVKQAISGLVVGLLLLSVSVLSLSTASSAQIGIGISVRIGPPALPVYEQPVCPGEGYLWTPGYWAWNDDGGYYWVPGTWVVAPVGLLWTPGYWGFAGGLYGWHAGYWGPHIGFYGGINYGFGYGGVGFVGGEWRGGAFYYNRSVMNVNVTNIHNVYNKTVIVNNVHTSFNGPGGIEARPTAQEESYSREQHTPALAAQTEHEHAASQNKALFASENHGRPAIAATAKPGDFSGRGVVPAKAAGAAYHAPKMSPKEARAPAGNHAEPARAEGARNEPARKEPTRNEPNKSTAARSDRPPAHAEKEKPAAHNNAARSSAAKSSEAHTAERPAETRSSAAHNASPAHNTGAAHNNSAASRPQASHENARPAQPKPAARPAAKAARPAPAPKAPKPAPKPEERKKGR